MDHEFVLRVDYEPHVARIKCSGDLDVGTAPRLIDAVSLVLEDPLLSELVVDLEGLKLLTSAGISCLLRVARMCRDREIAFRLRANDHARRVLDAVQLWWLGVVDDGVDLDEAMKRATQLYAGLPPEARHVGEAQ